MGVAARIDRERTLPAISTRLREVNGTCKHEMEADRERVLVRDSVTARMKQGTHGIAGTSRDFGEARRFLGYSTDRRPTGFDTALTIIRNQRRGLSLVSMVVMRDFPFSGPSKRTRPPDRGPSIHLSCLWVSSPYTPPRSTDT